MHRRFPDIGDRVSLNQKAEAADCDRRRYDDDLGVVVVRTKRATIRKELKRSADSGCAQGTVFGDLMKCRGRALRARNCAPTGFKR